jgi:hypothetical protein
VRRGCNVEEKEPPPSKYPKEEIFMQKKYSHVEEP